MTRPLPPGVDEFIGVARRAPRYEPEMSDVLSTEPPAEPKSFRTEILADNTALSRNMCVQDMKTPSDRK